MERQPTRFAIVAAALGVVVGFGLRAAEPTYGAWSARPHAEWPSIVMVNRVSYTDGKHPVAACGFLIENGDEIVAATAKHVLRYFKSESMETVSFGGTLTRWEMFLKDTPTDLAVVGALINEDPEESLSGFPTGRDWLLFTVERASEGMTPLRLRTTPLVAGEKVFVVGWRYTDEGRQHVYSGSYVRSEKDSILIDVTELRENTVPGLSGSPVVDAEGYVVGLMSSKSGKLERLAPVDYALEVLEMERPVVDRVADCAREMSDRFDRRGWIGITPEADAMNVISVAHVFHGSPAAGAGVREGDIIRGINGIAHDSDPAAVKAAYDAFRPGITVIFELERDRKPLSVEVQVEPIPEAVLEQWIRQECG